MLQWHIQPKHFTGTWFLVLPGELEGCRKSQCFMDHFCFRSSTPLVYAVKYRQLSLRCLVDTDGNALLFVPTSCDFWSEEETRMCFLCPADSCHGFGELWHRAWYGPILHSGLGLVGRCVQC